MCLKNTLNNSIVKTVEMKILCIVAGCILCEEEEERKRSLTIQEME